MSHTPSQSPGDSNRWSYSLTSFVHNEAFGGILLLVFAVVAMIWANSAWSDGYFDFFHATVTVGSADYNISLSLQHWINDALMALFFLVVGLEIKREVLVGELASLSRAAFPVLAAFGGAMVPALIFVAINWGGEGIHGWGIPMATDIAFALGILALVGSRVPVALKIFLTALAIADDLMAVLVIALFYTSDLNVTALLGAGVVLVLLFVANRLNVRTLIVYLGLGFALWFLVLDSGVHATIAGVLLAFAIPASTRIDPAAFLERSQGILNRFERESLQDANVLTDARMQEDIQELEGTINDVEAPLQNLEHALHPWIAYAIVPLFALANAGVKIDMSLGDALADPVTVGVIAGLVIGKQIGITLFAWLTVRFGLAVLPTGVTWRQIYGVSWLGGVGFTMSIFVTELAYDSEDLTSAAKIGILAASLIAGLAGWLVL
ncbi:MAG: Na+/H+ antiporter NhaA, partial [Chloroflexota bacterium]|nr:Na+/H+ antiporter NhaA [Chloroflexota bacterium]